MITKLDRIEYEAAMQRCYDDDDQQHGFTLLGTGGKLRGEIAVGRAARPGNAT